MAMSRTFSGPLPPPETLARYDQIVPGAAERILRMAEEQMKHRHSIEAMVVTSNATQQKHGPIYGFVIGMTVIIGGFVLIFEGKDTTGIAAIIAALSSLVGVFVYGKHEQKADLEKKRRSLPVNQD